MRLIVGDSYTREGVLSEKESYPLKIKGVKDRAFGETAFWVVLGNFEEGRFHRTRRRRRRRRRNETRECAEEEKGWIIEYN